MADIKLSHSLTVAGKKVDTLTMRRATVKDLKDAGRYGMDDESREIGLLAILTGLVPEDLELMDLADYKLLQNEFRAMVGG